jgi:glycosyltransferase involved in cell wall biosynthesis
MKVALVHDWLTGLRGGERCLLEFLKIFPDADILTLIHLKGKTDIAIDDRVKQQSFLGSLPQIENYYRYLLPIFPLAASTLNLNGYDLVICLSHAVAKNVTVPEQTLKICYCFTPMRYIWDQADQYFGKHTTLLQPILASLRSWDKRGAVSVNRFIAISKFIKARIRLFYGRSSDVIYPPVRTDWIRPIVKHKIGDAFLYAGALVPYKRPDVVVDTFNKLGLSLVVAGSGPMEAELKNKSKSNIIFTGAVSDSEMSELYRNARALVFPAIEDFGMIPVEIQAAGRPVIGFDRGGLRESVIGVRIGEKIPEDATGVFLSSRAENPSDELKRGIEFFLAHEQSFLPASCIKQASRFAPDRFATEIKALIGTLYA